MEVTEGLLERAASGLVRSKTGAQDIQFKETLTLSAGPGREKNECPKQHFETVS